MKKKSLAPYTTESIHPGFSIDCVILSYYKEKIMVLLYKFDLGDYWSLPGGFMLKQEDADEAAQRILKSRTGLTDIYLKQFYLFSDPKRTILEQNEEYVKENTLKDEDGQWLLDRFVSLGFYAFVKYDDVKLSKSESDITKWYNIHDLPKLYSDHKNIIETSIEMIKDMLPIIPIGYELLPEKFTMTELRTIYEIILGRTLERSNFKRKVVSEGLVIQLDEKKKSNAYNPPVLYSFNLSKKDTFYYSGIFTI